MNRFSKSWIFSAVIANVVVLPVFADDRNSNHLGVTFNECTEFVGLSPVDAAKARKLVPSGYDLITDNAGARLVIRVANCQAIRVNNRAPQAGTVAHIGIMIFSPDGTGTDPNTSINNYTLTYASNLPMVVNSLRSLGVPAEVDKGMTYEFSPEVGPSELYTAVSPDAANTVTWFLNGTVTNPEFPSSFLANWWGHSKKGEIKMSTDIPTIYFDFTSDVSFHTSRYNMIGQLLEANTIPSFPLSFRGQFSAAQMDVTLIRK